MAKDGSLIPRTLTEQDLVEREEKANTRQSINNAITSYQTLTGKMLPATPEDLKDYLLACVNKGYALATVTTRMALLTTWHDEYLMSQGFDGENNPCRHPSIVRRLRAVRRTIAAPQDQAEPLFVDQLAACIEALDDKIQTAEDVEDHRKRRARQLTAIRDKAMFLVAFWFGLRSESLTSIRAGNLEVVSSRHGNQLKIFLPETKNTAQFERTLDALDYLCPIPAVLDWQNASQPRYGDPFFVGVTQWGRLKTNPINVDSIIPMLRKVLDLAGIESQGFTSHSFRRGASIWADSMGASTRDRMEWFGWKDPTSALKYVEAKPSLPAMLQKQEDPLAKALTILETHIDTSERTSEYDPAFITNARSVIERLKRKMPQTVTLTALPE